MFLSNNELQKIGFKSLGTNVLISNKVSILVASIIFAIVCLSIIIYILFFCFYYAKLLFFFENTKRNGQKSKNETY